jgi:ABC-type Na+ efflux pump permease subunit
MFKPLDIVGYVIVGIILYAICSALILSIVNDEFPNLNRVFLVILLIFGPVTFVCGLLCIIGILFMMLFGTTYEGFKEAFGKKKKMTDERNNGTQVRCSKS